MFLQIGAQIFMKGSMQQLWDLYFSLQLIIYVPSFMKIEMPVSAELFVNALKSIIDFDMLKPDPLIQIYNPDFSLNEFLIGV
jgi:hypothetical protein